MSFVELLPASLPAAVSTRAGLTALATMLAIAAVALPLRPAAAADRHAAFVIDGNTGDVLRADNADEPRYPASLTKMMTLYLAFEAIEAGQVSYTTRLTVSQEAASQAPTKLDLDPGETIQMIDAIKSLITKSANDMAVVIAEHLGGSTGRFAEMMTDKARRLGMSRTTFRNPSGLPDPGQISTAHDMATLGLRLHDDFPTHYQLFSIKSFSYGRSSYRNHNNLLFNFQGTEGIKTGYTRASGFNLVASVRRGSRHVIGAIFGGPSASSRDDAMRLMLSHALMKASPLKTRKPAPVLVAQMRQAERPQPQPRAAVAPQPAPEIVSAAPAPRPLTPAPKLAARPERNLAERSPVVAVAQPAPAASVPQAVAQPSPVKIDVARVKPVMVPLRSRTSHAAADPAPAARAPAIAFVPTGEPAAPPARAAPPAPKVAAVASKQAPGPTSGAAPSTLTQQAANLARGNQPVAQPVAQFVQASATPPYSLRGPQPQPVASTATGISPGGFEVQIGAYGSTAEAEHALVTTRTNASDLLQGRASRAVPVQKESRQFYRARFSGFDSKTAAATCLELRRRQIDCFVMKAE